MGEIHDPRTLEAAVLRRFDRGGGLGRQRHAGSHDPLQAVDDDPVAGVQATFHDAFAVDKSAQGHEGFLGGVGGGKGPHVAETLFGAHGEVRDEDHGFPGAAGDAQAGVESRHQHPARIGKGAADHHRTRIRIQAIVEMLNSAVVGETGAIGDLQRLDPAELGRRYGDEGLKLARLSRGEDHRAVTPNGESKSISAETTFETDISDPETLEQTLIALGERVAQRLRKADYAGSTITLKLKTPDFKQVTRSRALTAPTQLGHRISALGRELLAKEPKGRKYRLIGIGVSDLGPSDAADRGDLLDVTAPKEAALERTLDRLRDRFGSQSVKRAVLMPKQRRQIPQGAIPASKPEK